MSHRPTQFGRPRTANPAQNCFPQRMQETSEAHIFAICVITKRRLNQVVGLTEVFGTQAHVAVHFLPIHRKNNSIT